MIRTALILIIFALAACSSHPKRTAKSTNEPIETWGDALLCVAFGARFGNGNVLLSEIKKRELMTDNEVRAAMTVEPRVGMSECTAYASFGYMASGVGQISIGEKGEPPIKQIKRYRCSDNPRIPDRLCPMVEVWIEDTRISYIGPKTVVPGLE